MSAALLVKSAAPYSLAQQPAAAGGGGRGMAGASVGGVNRRARGVGVAFLCISPFRGGAASRTTALNSISVSISDGEKYRTDGGQTQQRRAQRLLWQRAAGDAGAYA